MNELAHQQFARIIAEVAAAHSREAAIDIIRGAKFAGQLGALSETQYEQLCDAVREIGDAS